MDENYDRLGRLIKEGDILAVAQAGSIIQLAKVTHFTTAGNVKFKTFVEDNYNHKLTVSNITKETIPNGHSGYTIGPEGAKWRLLIVKRFK